MGSFIRLISVLYKLGFVPEKASVEWPDSLPFLNASSPLQNTYGNLFRFA